MFSKSTFKECEKDVAQHQTANSEFQSSIKSHDQILK